MMVDDTLQDDEKGIQKKKKLGKRLSIEIEVMVEMKTPQEIKTTISKYQVKHHGNKDFLVYLEGKMNKIIQ